MTESEIARAVFKTCGFLDECEIKGIIDQSENLLSVSEIRKIDTDNEPSNTIILYAAYGVALICQHVSNDMRSNVVIKIEGSRSSTINNEVFWLYDFSVNINKQSNAKPIQLEMQSMRLVKREGKWYYFRHGSEAAE